MLLLKGEPACTVHVAVGTVCMGKGNIICTTRQKLIFFQINLSEYH